MEAKGANIHRFPGAVCEDAERARGSAENGEPVEGEQSVRLSAHAWREDPRTSKSDPWEPMGRTGSGETSTAKN